MKRYDFDGLKHDAKDKWTENGKPVDWSKHLTRTVFYAPNNPTSKQEISMKVSEWTKLYGVRFPATDQDKMYNVKAIAPLIAVATTERKQNREDANQTFKEKHDALNATINAARTNITQYNSEKRELIRQGYGESDPDVRDLDAKIADEQKREAECDRRNAPAYPTGNIRRAMR